jgi:hypothetical protein
MKVKRMLVTCDVAELEEAEITTHLVSRTCPRERIGKGVIFHAGDWPNKLMHESLTPPTNPSSLDP